MALIWADAVKAQRTTGCTYDIPTITALGTPIEQFIQNELDMNGLAINPPLPGATGYVTGSGSGMLIEVSQHWLCREIRIQQKHDGTFPDSIKEGTMGLTLSINESIKFYDDKGRLALDKYIRSLTGAELDSTDWYAGGLFLAGEDL